MIRPTTMSPTSPLYLKDKTKGHPSVRRLDFKSKRHLRFPRHRTTEGLDYARFVHSHHYAARTHSQELVTSNIPTRLTPLTVLKYTFIASSPLSLNPYFANHTTMRSMEYFWWVPEHRWVLYQPREEKGD